MKIPSSSSLLFATLAVSSSSSSLALPIGDECPPGFEAVSPRMVHTERGFDSPRIEHTPRQLEDVADLLGNLPVVGPVLGPLIDALGLGHKGVVSAASTFDAEDIQKIQAAASQVSSAISAKLAAVTPGVPVPIGVLPRSGDISAEAVPLVGSLPIPPAVPINAPITPNIPIVPPNTPSIPVALPIDPLGDIGKLPIPPPMPLIGNPAAIVGSATSGPASVVSNVVANVASVPSNVANMAPSPPVAIPSVVGNAATVPQAILSAVPNQASATSTSAASSSSSQPTSA